jgi:hypothetical protein
VQYELRQGRAVRAEVQRFGDVANVVVGAASAVELAGTAITAAGVTEILGCSTVLLAGFSATPWGLLLSAGGALIVAGSALALDVSQPREQRLMEIEKAIDQACRDEIRGQRLLVSTRLDGLLSAVDRAWSGAHGSAG